MPPANGTAVDVIIFHLSNSRMLVFAAVLLAPLRVGG